MLQTVFNEQTVFVLNDAPNWAQAVTATFSMIRDTQAGLTKREARRPYSDTPLIKLEYSVILHDEILRVAQASMRALNTQAVVVPFWPAQRAWSDRAANGILGGLRLVWKSDWSQFEIFSVGDDEPEWPADDDYFAPALMGFAKPSDLDQVTSNIAKWDVEFTESSPADYCLAFTDFTHTAGPAPAGYAAAPLLLPFRPDFTQISERINVDVARKSLGFVREQHATFYPHTTYRSQTASFTLDGGADAEFLRFFFDVAAPGAAFWASGYLHVAKLTVNALATDTVLHVEDSVGVLLGDYVSFNGRACGKITGKTADTITLAAPVGVELSIGDPNIFPLSLARLDKATVKMKWMAVGVATADLAWTEQPPEVLIPASETLGTTLGKLPLRVVLFQFVRDFGNGTVTNHYGTSFGRDLVYDGHTWLHDSWNSGDINRTLNLEDDSCTFDFDFTKPDGTLASTNPLLPDVTCSSEAVPRVKIFFADYDGAAVTNVKQMFDGECTKFNRNGNRVKVACKFGSGLFDTMLPVFVRGRMCNHVKGSNFSGDFLISAGCSLLKSDWKFTATVAAPVDDSFPFSLYVANLARAVGVAPTYFADWFAAGRVEIWSRTEVERRFILSSTNPVAGAMVLTLSRYFSELPTVGDELVIYPGCPGTYRACKAYHATNNPDGKFGNDANYGGNPFMPVADPSMVGQPDTNVAGGKK